jgi:hypothetical protein
MKKHSAFNEAKPRTPKGEARQREIKAIKAMEELLDLDEEEFRQRLAEKYGIPRGSPKHDEIMAIWREERRGGF